MSTAAKYLAYRLKKTLPKSAAIALVTALILYYYLSQNVINGIKPSGETRFDCCAMGMATVAFVIATLIPFFELAQFKNRRNLDTLYFLPLNKDKMAKAHFLSGLIQTIAIFTVEYILYALYLIIKSEEFCLAALIPYYFALAIFSATLYAFICFFFIQGNTVADGVIFSLVWTFVFSVVVLAIQRYVNRYTGNGVLISAPAAALNEIAVWSYAYSPFINIANQFEEIIEKGFLIGASTSRFEFSFGYIAWLIIGLACAIGYVHGFKNSKIENAGEISSSVFGYKLLIPTLAYSIYFLASPTVAVITAGGMVACYVLFRRGVKFTKSDIIVMACSVIPLCVAFIW